MKSGDMALFGVACITGLAAVYSGTRLLTDEHDSPRPPRLAAVIDGGMMEEFLESPEEKAAILGWVDEGAPRSSWADVSRILEQRCVSCHYSDDARFMMLALDRYEPAARAAAVRPVLEEEITGGTMGKYLESPAQQAAIVAWVTDGAPKSAWQDVKTILDANCVHCHNPEGVAGIPFLDVAQPTIRLARVETFSRPIGALIVPIALSTVSILGFVGWQRRRDASG